MKLTELLAPNRIILGLRASDKAQVLNELAKRASAHLPIECATIYAALVGREELGSTGFGGGFALPHVRMSGLKESFGLMARLARPVAYDAIDSKPVDILFMLLIPADNGGSHVAALAAVSRSMRNEELMRVIRKAGSPTAVFEALAEVERPSG